ncbi:restriction endonuclease subunit S [Streptomyces sp. NPDC048001]|uniref:restriction endonuclease subunit S n=1 Tax=Streptomyces sp. NPDC048001 TaxID=3365498 RepID=UPI0037232D3A
MTWRSVRLKHQYRVIDCRAGMDQPPLLAVSIHHGVVPRDSLTDKLPRAEDLSHYKVCLPGDIVLNRMRAFQGAIGISPVRGLVSPDYLVMRPNRDTDARYLHHLFRSHWFVGEMISRLRGIGGTESGSVRTPRINSEDLGDISVPLPALEEQRRIADFLDAESAQIDRLVESQQQISAKLTERRVAGVIAAVTGAHHPDRRRSGLAWSATLPGDWKEVRLGLVARMGSGHTPSRSHPEWWIDCTIPWITTGEVSQVRDDRREEITETREKISELGLENSSAELCPAGTVVLCRTASAGYSAVMGTEMATSQDFVTWICGPRLDPYYLLWCLRAMRQDLLGRLAMGSTHKTIYVPDLQMLRIPLPGLAEQRRIVEEIRDQNRDIDRLADAVKRQIALLVERRQALTTAAVTGQLDVTTARPTHN